MIIAKALNARGGTTARGGVWTTGAGQRSAAPDERSLHQLILGIAFFAGASPRPQSASEPVLSSLRD
jgi:hypothetical protein